MVNRTVSAVISIAAFLGVWWAIAAYNDSVLLPTPWETITSFVKLIFAPSGWQHVLITIYRVFTGTLLGAVAGTILGIITRYNRIAETAVKTVVFPVLQSVPTLCWTLIFVLWFGLKDTTPILTIVVAVAPFFIINVWEGMKELDANLIEMAHTHTDSRFKLLRKIVLPMLYPYIFAATRSSFMTAWKKIIPAEIFGAVSAWATCCTCPSKATASPMSSAGR
jgi:ABC-type nitrate/sulfonate/bicarbonate transport system permease component